MVLALNDFFSNSTANLGVVTDSLTKWFSTHNGFYTQYVAI